jgi:hypothetical protein
MSATRRSACEQRSRATASSRGEASMPAPITTSSSGTCGVVGRSGTLGKTCRVSAAWRRWLYTAWPAAVVSVRVRLSCG